MNTLLMFLFILIISTIIFSSLHAFDTTKVADLGEKHENYTFKKATRELSQYSVAPNLTILSSLSDSKNSSSNISLRSDNDSEGVTFDLSSFQRKSYNSCNAYFSCGPDFSTGWNDRTSIQLSTNNTEDDGSKIIGKEVDVKPNESTQLIIGKEVDVKPKESIRLITHMKLNDWVIDARIGLDGFNGTSKSWYFINNCPTYSLRGPMDWQEFNCGFTMEGNTTKVRPVLDAGRSAHPQREATTWFDSISIMKFKPFLADPNLMTQIVYEGLEEPVSMAFLDTNDFLVTERSGNVQRIVNGVKLAKPVLDLDAVGDGLLGIAVSKNGAMSGTGTNRGTPYVFLYLIEGSKGEVQNLHNRLYRYELVNETLVNPKLLLDLPPGRQHNGGPILIGWDNYIYIMIGELDGKTIIPHIKNRALNYKGADTNDADGRGGILRIDKDGRPIGANSVLADTKPFNKYYAYGIRNSFGMDFDPISGKLWDTENGPAFGDEINIVEPGFNSGWNRVQGIWYHQVERYANASDITYHPSGLVTFDGKGKYRSPEFVWKYTVGPTALKFLNSDKLGKQYENDIFIGDVNNGRIYHFKLNQNRTGLLLDEPLMDKVADTDTELDKVIFAGDFGIITDIKVGPDGYLYFVVFNEGKIYRIVPRV